MAVEALEPRTAPAVFSVTSLADSNDLGSGSLRRAITDSNATPGPNEIDILTPGTYQFTLSGTATDNSAGELSILNYDVTLLNQSGGPVVIDAGGVTRVLDVSPTGPGINVTITGVTIQDGNAMAAHGGGIQVTGTSTLTLNNDIVQNNTAHRGGGIDMVSTSSLTLNNDIVQNNTAQLQNTFGQIGGGIFARGPVTLNATTVSNNLAIGNGGGVYAASIVVQNHSVITGNTAGDSGGGLFSFGPITVTDSSVTNNQCGGISPDAISTIGGGIWGGEGVTVLNSIVSNNVDFAANGLGGGGIMVQGGYLTIMNSLITSNETRTAPFGGVVPESGGGGIFIDRGVWATIKDSVIAGNTSVWDGGGLLLRSTGMVTIVGCEIAGNTAANDGGGLYSLLKKDASVGGPNSQILTILASTFFQNRASGLGGGLFVGSDAGSTLEAPTANLTDVTITENSAAFGGGLCTLGYYLVNLLNDTIAFNNASDVGGGVSAHLAPLLTFTNTIVARNSAGPRGHPDVDSAPEFLVDGGNNFIGDNTGATPDFAAGTPNANGSYVGSGDAPLDPLLAAPADNGGAVVLPDGSHVLTVADQPNNGPNGVVGRGNAAAAPGADERGFFPRPVGAHSDIGAFQFQGADLAVSVTGPGNVRVGRPATFTITVQNLGPNTSRGATLTDAVPAGMTILGASGNPTLIGNALFWAVPDLPAGGSASFTVTVLPNVPGQFTDVAEVSTHDDPNLGNNTATAHIRVLPAAFPAAGSADVTSLVQLIHLGRRRRPQRRLVFRLTNVGGVPLQGPLGVVVAGLPRGVALRNAGGRTRGRQPFVRVDIGGDDTFDPGASAFVTLVFSQPVNPRGLRVLAGAFA